MSAEKCRWCDGSRIREVTHLGTGERHGVPCVCQFTDLPVPFFYQPEVNGCGVAAVAIATGRPYADVRKMVSHKFDLSEHGTEGVDVCALDELLCDLGYALQRRTERYYRLNRLRDDWPCAPWAAMHVAFTRNLSDTCNHFVAMLEDGRVLDPWWGVVSGLHRYPAVHSITAIYRIRVVATSPESEG